MPCGGCGKRKKAFNRNVKAKQKKANIDIQATVKQDEKNRNARVGRIQSRQERIAARKARIAARSARIAARNDRIKLRAQRAEAAKTAEQTKSDS